MLIWLQAVVVWGITRLCEAPAHRPCTPAMSRGRKLSFLRCCVRLARGLKRDHNTMSDDLKFQLRLTLSDEFAQVARNVPGDPSISTLTDILNRHDAVMKCQFDAFADYVSEAEANGIENFDLYEWTKKTIDDPAKKSKYTKSFALYVGGDEVYEKDKADALEAELKPLVGGPIVAKMFKYDTDPAHNPQAPRQT